MHTEQSKTIRVSALPRFLACPSSEAPCEHPVDTPSDAADVGTAVHECAAAMVMGRDYDATEIARAHGVDPEEVSILTACARQAWEEVERFFPSPQVELALAAPGLRGHVDVIQSGETCVVLDWKTGRVRRDHTSQLMGYAACAVHELGMPTSERITIITAWLRMGELDVRHYTPSSLDGFRARVDDARRNIGKVYGPGEPCGYCPRRHACEARIEYVRNCIETLDGVRGNWGIDETRLADLWQRTRVLKKAVDAYERAVRSVLVERELETSDGYRLEMRRDTVETLHAERAWPVLLDEGLPVEALAKCVKLSKTAVTRELSERTARGRKGKAIEALMDRLRAADAVRMEERTSVRRKKVGK
ncbi:MAG: DUF2800 domain-containing protein [Gammaproteobacteria bacterium]|nr:DUF2800 domain-containing protein [Gammaproteobacteria bacterium]NIV51082.1 DUF2800 domain-containing protein [Gammaproteobacteria bacterium]NIW23932.1 DUF2800 domain-containing protein [Gammaproteobacteria bacterium]NIX85025.1 DUF2800 domain-containing protein [Gammaproteobacteria bacterium]